MIAIVGMHGWQTVLDDSYNFGDVLTYNPQEWLPCIPTDMQNVLAVMHQNVIHHEMLSVNATLAYDEKTDEAGYDAMLGASMSLVDAVEKRNQVLEKAKRAAETILSAGTHR